jgi:AmmeMemoRadiSam system protein B
MPLPERPQLHPYIRWEQDWSDPRFVFLVNRAGVGPGPLRMPVELFCWLQLFDGRRTLRDIQAEAMRQADGRLLPLELFNVLVQKLDEAMLLDGPRLRELLASPVREPACVGSYAGNPDVLRRQLHALFTGPGGPGLPSPPPRPSPARGEGEDTPSSGRGKGEDTPSPRAREGRGGGPQLRAALLPHIDYGRGGVSYAWGFKEVALRTDAALFVIIGTSHYSSHRFTLTRKHFKTPLGIVPTDQPYIDRLVAHYGDGLFDDEYQAQLPEHSIELEVVFLQYLYEQRRPIRIVPLVVGSFQDSVAAGSLPAFREDVGRMVAALRAAEAETAEPICYIISGDLAHIGPKFDDPDPVSDAQLIHSREQDQAILRAAEAANPEEYFRLIADEGDRRRICGLPPTYTVLEALRPSRGKVLHYDQYVHPRRYESVSFASVVFYR